MAERFARERAKVVVADIDARALAAVVDSIKPGRRGAGRADGRDGSRVPCRPGGGPPSRPSAGEVLCNNAGVALWGGLESATHRDWQWVLSVNLWGVITASRRFVRG